MKKRQALVFAVDWKVCLQCGACVAVCPQDAGFISAFDTIAVETACGIACLDCERICPVTAISDRAARQDEIADDGR